MSVSMFDLDLCLDRGRERPLGSAGGSRKRIKPGPEMIVGGTRGLGVW